MHALQRGEHAVQRGVAKCSVQYDEMGSRTAPERRPSNRGRGPHRSGSDKRRHPTAAILLTTGAMVCARGARRPVPNVACRRARSASATTQTDTPMGTARRLRSGCARGRADRMLTGGAAPQAAAKLWGGRFSGKTDPLFEKFNASLSFDSAMWEADIIGATTLRRGRPLPLPADTAVPECAFCRQPGVRQGSCALWRDHRRGARHTGHGPADRRRRVAGRHLQDRGIRRGHPYRHAPHRAARHVLRTPPWHARWDKPRGHAQPTSAG